MDLHGLERSESLAVATAQTESSDALRRRGHRDGSPANPSPPRVSSATASATRTSTSLRAGGPYLPLKQQAGRHRHQRSMGHVEGDRVAGAMPSSPSWIADISYYAARESKGGSSSHRLVSPLPLTYDSKLAAARQRGSHRQHDAGAGIADADADAVAGGDRPCLSGSASGLSGSRSGQWRARSRRMSRRARQSTYTEPPLHSASVSSLGGFMSSATM